MTEKPDNKNLQYWYYIKPFAAVLFNDNEQELFWIKKTWLLLCTDEDTGIVKAVESFRDEDISDDLKFWLMALYDININFRHTIDGFWSEHEYELWAERLNLDVEDCSEAFLANKIQKKKDLFINTLSKTFEDDYQILLFMTNDSAVIDEAAFETMFCELNESRINSYDDYCAVLDIDYAEYKQDRVVDLNFEKQSTAYSWISENLKPRDKSE